MDFSEALALMKQGKKMRRREWVTLKCSPYKWITVKDNRFFDELGMRVDDIYQEDILANDWEEVK